MNKKFIIIIAIFIVASVGVSAFLIVQDSNNQDNNLKVNTTKNITNESLNNTTSSDNIEFTNHKGTVDENNVVVSANCQKTAYQGTNAVIIWKITNNGNETIKNVEASDQGGYHNFGDIAPSQTKVYRYTMYIPTNNDLKIDFGMENGQWPGPLWIGGYGVSYSIGNETFGTNANVMEIQVKV